MRKKSKQKKPKKQWTSPQLSILADVSYELEKDTLVYAQYGGGGGTVTHSAGGRKNSVYTLCE